MNEAHEAPIARREHVDDIYVKTAEELLHRLRPHDELWRDDPSGWIFRGQTDANWRLQPSAHRNLRETFAKVGVSSAVGADRADWSVRKDLLDKLLNRFGDGLNRSGIVVPALNPETDWRRRPQVQSSAHPDHHLFPLMALAQHHGLPTILLDWSRRSLVGAYFAVVDAADESRRKTETHVAVWALHRGHERPEQRGLTFFEAPASTNPNLRAQDGLFTVMLPIGQYDAPSVEEFMAHLAALRTDVNAFPKIPPMKRIMLPVVETKKVLRLLSYEGVTGASMFPGTDGVVRAMRETVNWDRPPA